MIDRQAGVFPARAPVKAPGRFFTFPRYFFSKTALYRYN